MNAMHSFIASIRENLVPRLRAADWSEQDGENLRKAISGLKHYRTGFARLAKRHGDDLKGVVDGLDDLEGELRKFAAEPAPIAGMPTYPGTPLHLLHRAVSRPEDILH